MRFLPAALIVFLSIASAFPAQAGSTGTQPTAASNTLWIHRNSADAVYWLSNVKDEPSHDDPDPGYNVAGAALSNPDGPGYLWSIPMDPAPSAPIQLTPDAPIEFSVYIKAITSVPVAGGVGQGAGAGSISMTLKAGGAAIAEGAGQDVTLTPDTWSLAKWSLKPTVAAISGEVAWDILFTGGSGGAVLGAADASGWTSFVLPIVGGATAPAVVHERINGTSVQVSQAFDNATTASYRYDWTNGLADPRLTVSSNGTGSWNLTILDNGQPRYAQRFEANGTVSDGLDGAGMGNWTVWINTTGFQGTLGVAIEPTPAASPTQSSSATGTSSKTTPTAPANATGNATTQETEAKDTPAPAAPLVLAGVALAAVALRRRRA